MLSSALAQSAAFSLHTVTLGRRNANARAQSFPGGHTALTSMKLRLIQWRCLVLSANGRGPLAGNRKTFLCRKASCLASQLHFWTDICNDFYIFHHMLRDLQSIYSEELRYLDNVRFCHPARDQLVIASTCK